MRKKLEAVEEELKECEKGNFHIQQYNNQLIKARDEADAEVDKSKAECNSLYEALKRGSKTVVEYLLGFTWGKGNDYCH